MLENDKKKISGPLLYAIIGVTVLVVAVAGSAYAFFAASATDTGTIKGDTLDIKLGLKVEKVSTGTGNLIPIHDGSNAASQLAKAASASSSCVDDNGRTVCHIYKITISNTGGDNATVNSTVALTGSANLKWANMSNQTTVGATHAKTDTTVATNASVNAGGNSVQYIMVYINNTGDNQTAADGGTSFSGVITVTASTGEAVQATFN